MKSACLYYNKHSTVINKHLANLGPLVFILFQVGLHAWTFEETLVKRYYLFGPILLSSIFLYFIVRCKNPGVIPVVKAEIPIENNQIEVQIENQVKREVLNAQANDESNGQISLDQFKENSENDNTVQKYYTLLSSYHQEKPLSEIPPITDTKLILSGREMLSSPSSEQAKMTTPHKLACVSTANAVSVPILAAEKRFCMQCLNEQPIRAKHCQYCKKCIPMFDHHCPWIGICIGEKNKLIFVIYLLVQITQLIIGIRILVFNIGVLVIMSILVLLLVTLTAFHIFYIAKNITTCKAFMISGEFLSWKRITYITEKERFPFDRGVINNIGLLVRISFQSAIYPWQLSQQ